MASRRSELERQALIAELRRLRADGVNVDRQDVIEEELRRDFELGWPRRRAVRVHANGVSV